MIQLRTGDLTNDYGCEVCKLFMHAMLEITDRQSTDIFSRKGKDTYAVKHKSPTPNNNQPGYFLSPNPIQ